MSLLNCLAGAIPGTERIISAEEVFELKLSHPDAVAMQTRQPNLEGTGEITLRRLVKEALRMRPDRIIVGEVREKECLDLLIALNSGLPGMCSIHANSAREAIVKLCTLPLLAGVIWPPPESVRECAAHGHKSDRRSVIWPCHRRSPGSTLTSARGRNAPR